MASLDDSLDRFFSLLQANSISAVPKDRLHDEAIVSLISAHKELVERVELLEEGQTSPGVRESIRPEQSGTTRKRV